MNKKAIVASLITIVATLTLSTVNAEQRKGPRGGKPPTEAIEACASLSEAESCSFNGLDGDINGSSKAAPRGDGALACIT